MSKKSEGEAASMFDDEDFDAAYRGTASSHMPTNSPDDDDDEDEDLDDDEEEFDETELSVKILDDDEEPEDDDAAWEEAQRAPLPPEDVEEEETEDAEALTVETDDNTAENDDAEVSAARDILANRSPKMAKNTMMSTGRGTGATKSEMIRDEISKRQESGDSLRAKDIIATLNKRGIEVNASQVSVTLRSMGVAPSRGPNAVPQQQQQRATAKVSRDAVVGPRRGRKPRSEEQSETTAHRAKKVASPADTPIRRKATAGAPTGTFSMSELRDARAFLNSVGGREHAAVLFDALEELSG